MAEPPEPNGLTEGHHAIIRLLARQAAEAYLQQRAEKPPLRFLRTSDVCDKIACSRSRLYELLEQDDTFPRPCKDGDTRQAPNYWVEHEVEEWMRKRMERSRPAK